MSSLKRLPADWAAQLETAISAPQFFQLAQFIEDELDQGEKVFPPLEFVFRSLELTPFQKTKVVILGQDPYHRPGQATGLSFSVPNSHQPKPPSLKNIFKELASDVGVIAPRDQSDLTGWAKQGVLLLNTSLTVREGTPLSHQSLGWEPFTQSVIEALGKDSTPRVFILWGSHAQKYRSVILRDHRSDFHRVLESAHPSPLSAHRGFFGSKPFSKTNQALQELGHSPIDWGNLTD